MKQFRIIYKYPSEVALSMGNWWNADNDQLADFLFSNAAMDGFLYDIEVRNV